MKQYIYANSSKAFEKNLFLGKLSLQYITSWLSTKYFIWH